MGVVRCSLGPGSLCHCGLRATARARRWACRHERAGAARTTRAERRERERMAYLEQGDYSVGLHFDAYPPDQDSGSGAIMEFWITVVKA